MRIVFMGSAPFAVPSLEALLRSGHDVALVVTQCDKPAGRGLKVHACAVAECAKKHSIPLFQPPTLKEPETRSKIGSAGAELIVIVAYGKILPKEVLKMPKLGCVNVHASLLPKYRGAAPINWAIVNGETRTGVTTMFINERMDAGDILLQKESDIGADECAPALYERLAGTGAELLIETITKIESGTVKPKPQNEGEATYAPIIRKEDGLIDWQKSAREIANLVRGMQPWPVAHTYIDGKMLKIFGATAHPGPLPPFDRAQGRQGEREKPGTIVEAGKNLAVATGEGTLYLTDVQLEGKKRMAAEAFLRGHKIKEGNRFSTSLKQ